jgi:peptidoglycan-N-acetylglucosamine deacetylase
MNILTFDIEEWFHILDNNSTKTDRQWSNFESRIRSNMDRIFLILEKTNSNATFFCLGWIAEQYPNVIKEIHDRGYEIGTHTHMHQLIYEQQPREFEIDVERSIKTLEDITGSKIKYFRAPGFSITEDNKWAFDVLHKYNIEIDCSIFPAQRAHGGFPSYGSSMPAIIKYNGIELRELPISYATVFNKPFIFSGGGYFRLFPYPLIKYWSKKSKYMMTYIHPRDLDEGQPLIQGLSFRRKFKSYVGLKNAEKKLNKWLTEFDFIDISSASKLIDWANVKKINI